MLDRFSSSLRIGLSKTGITLVKANVWRRPKIEVLADVEVDEGLTCAESMVESLQNLLTDAKVRRLPTTVVLADDWVRYFTVTPPTNAARLQDCLAAASMRFQTLYGTPATDWRLEGEWDAYRPFLTCAIPRWLPEAVIQVARAHKFSLLGVLPEFVAAWNRWQAEIQDETWFGMVQGRQLAFCRVQKRRLSAVHTISIPVDGHESSIWLTENISRAALMLGFPMPAQLQLCGNMPATWLDSHDALVVSRLDIAPHVQRNAGVSTGVALAMQGLLP